MKRHAMASLAVALFVSCMTAAENLVSGPQVGEKVSGNFSVLFLNGEHAGTKRCPVDVKGYDLTALLFARDISDPLIALIRRLDKQLDAASGRGPDKTRQGVFVV